MAVKKKAKPKKKADNTKAGRPTKYTQELADLICERLARGKSMRTVCDMPDIDIDARNIFRWLRTNDLFRQQYEKAKAEAADAMVDEMLDIADDGRNDWMESLKDDDSGKVAYKVNGEYVQRSRLRLDARKWIASKLKPKKYGDRVETVHSGSIGLHEMSDDELERHLKALQSKVESGE